MRERRKLAEFRDKMGIEAIGMWKERELGEEMHVFGSGGSKAKREAMKNLVGIGLE